ncbi:hypothetical protein EWM64_g1854 [Hericium alpestre]|uniref:Uncharacterized protein n=1 Tax=Hericium alpestre TaxID=135208 RepID=A0A4Z0A572_9AGAM|nr:hypothetical protein EWM64_g1854 [Hericium alpestre]
MHSIVVALPTLVLLVLVSFTQAAESVEGRTPDPARCPGAKVVSTNHVPVEGQNVTFATFACDHSAASKVPRSPRPTTRLIEKRDSSECTTPVNNECFCGQACLESCTSTTDLAPTPSNCAVIAQAMKILGTNNAIGQTFFVDSGNSVLVFFSDCEFEWDNLSNRLLEYCWDDFANIGTTLQIGCTSGANTGGTCLSETDDWQIQLLFV